MTLRLWGWTWVYLMGTEKILDAVGANLPIENEGIRKTHKPITLLPELEQPPMDPTTCLREMNEAMLSGDRETAQERALDLKEWVRKGGFLPGSMGNMSRRVLQNQLNVVLAATADVAEAVEA